MSRYCLGAALAFLIVGCTVAPVTRPPAPPVRVVTTASAQPFVRAATESTLTGPTPFMITAAALPDLLLAAGQEPVIGVTLYLPEGTALWVTPLGEEPVVVIVNASQAVEALSLAQLQTIYAGRDSQWAAAGREAGDDSRLFFELQALRGLKPAATLRVAPSPEAMLAFVSSTANGIGYLPFRWLRAGVKALSIEGKAPTEAGYPLNALIVAVAKEEPSGPAREWLGRVQSRGNK